MQILIADDELVSRRLLESTLAGWGYSVTVCATGAEAWEALERDDAPQLVVLEIGRASCRERV